MVLSDTDQGKIITPANMTRSEVEEEIYNQLKRDIAIKVIGASEDPLAEVVAESDHEQEDGGDNRSILDNTVSETNITEPGKE